jgi:Na+(H+)/acetate symporter ActP
VFAPELAEAGAADALVLLLPGMLVPGPLGDALTALVIAGAFGAFLSTSSGLVVSLAGVISQDLFGGSVLGFRIAAVASSIVPLAVALTTASGGLAGSVGLVFAFTASTLCPVLLLGIWWRGLTARGAVAGMVVGAIACGAAILSGQLVDGQELSWLRGMLQQPAAWTVPLAFATTVLISRADRRGVPKNAVRFLTRLHTPEGSG